MVAKRGHQRHSGRTKPVTRTRVRVGVVRSGLIAQVMQLPHLRELIEFHTCLTADREPKRSGLDGLRDVQLCEALVAAHEARGQ